MPNIFVAYDLNAPGKNYDAVHEAIQGLGQWYRFQLSLYYVHTDLSVREAYRRVLAAMDVNDRLAVIDAQGGIVTTWDRPPIEQINTIWQQA